MADPRVIDLNSDLGEGGDVAASLAVDGPILAVVTSTNVATGAHAGGGDVLVAVAQAALAVPVAVGAHPSYRDRSGFGRASHLPRLHADPGYRAEVVADLVVQIRSVAKEVSRQGGQLHHCKPHGALYNDAVQDPLAAAAVLEATRRVSELLGEVVPLVTLPVGDLWQMCTAAGWPAWREGFADRAYTADGTLVPRSQSGAVLHDVSQMQANALALAERVDTICVHGDTPGALTAAMAVRDGLSAAGWTVQAP